MVPAHTVSAMWQCIADQYGLTSLFSKIQRYLIEYSEGKTLVKRLTGLLSEKYPELREGYLKKLRDEWFTLRRSGDFTKALVEIAEDDRESVEIVSKYDD